jgi:hypothetical protein
MQSELPAEVAEVVRLPPLGHVLAGPHFEEVAILTAELDRGEIARGKYDFDVAGHYARRCISAAGE